MVGFGRPGLVDRGVVASAALEVAERVAGMVRHLPGTDLPIPGSEWTVGEQAAHLAYTNIGLAIVARGLFIPYAEGTREGFAAANAASLDGYPDRDGALLAGRVVEGMKAFLAEAAAQPPGGVYQTPMGTMDMDTFVSYVLTHNLMHGCAMADGLGVTHPFEPRHGAMVWPFLAHAFPLMFQGDAMPSLGGDGVAVIEIEVDGAFTSALVFGSGDVSVQAAAPRPPDCSISADPLTFFRVFLKLMRVEDAVDREGMRIWGPRPELGRLLPTLYEVP